MLNFRELFKFLKRKDKNKEEKSFRDILIVYFGITLGIVVLLLLALLVLGILYLSLKTDGLLIALSIILPLFLLGVIALIIYSFTKIDNTFYNGFYKTTKRNYQNFYNEKRSLEKYVGNISEAKELNEQIDKIDVYQSNVVLVTKFSDYSHIPLEYFNLDLNLINEKTFKMYIKEIIGSSSCYRNAVIEVDFDVKQELSEEIVNKFAKATNKIFPKKAILISLMMNKKGFYIYVPNIDSLSYFKSQINSLFETLVLVTKSFSGIGLVSPKINAVIYWQRKAKSIDKYMRQLSY